MKDQKAVLLIAPFSSMLAFIMNIPGMEYGFFYPSTIKGIKMMSLSIIPNIGLLCILPCIFIYSLRRWHIRQFYLILIFAAAGTVSDLMDLALGYLVYGRGWNIMHTFFMFLIALSIVYLYYLWLRELRIT